MTVLVPVMDEEADVAGCIAAIASQDHPRERMQVVLADAGSTDATRSVADGEAARLGLRLEWVDNPARRTSSGLNRGLAVARGEVVVRVDARSRIPSHYVSTCVRVLAERPEVGVVGGAQVALARSDRAVDAGIARALANRWATGLARYRRVTGSGPADTVWMGAFRTRELRALGGWSDAVALNEDYELNERYRASGAVVWFEGALRSGYLPRRSIGDLARQYFRFGRVKGTWWARGRRPAWRQVGLVLAPPATGAALLAIQRQVGLAPALLAAGAGVAFVDTVAGPRRAARPLHRLVSSTGIAVIGASWWTGTVVGWLGEHLGVEHRHG